MSIMRDRIARQKVSAKFQTNIKFGPARVPLKGKVKGLLIAGCLVGELMGSALPALAQSADNGTPRPDIVKPSVAPPSGRAGPLASVADRLAQDGITFHAISLDFFLVNPSSGLTLGHTQNSLYNILGFDVDLSKRTGLRGSSLHYETTLFAFNKNLSYLSQVGDSLLGYEATFNKEAGVISVATFEQKAFNDRLNIEVGRTHPNRYYGIPLCQSLDSCFQDIFYYNAGFTSPQYSVWGGNVSYQATKSMYVQAGVFSTDSNAHLIGYDITREDITGAVGMAEVGYKTDFTTEAYPARLSLTGFVNTSPHPDYNFAAALNPASTVNRNGSSGAVIQAQKVVWRADGGATRNPSPTSIAVYGSFGQAFDSTSQIQSDLYVGATLQSPFAGRPGDRFGVKFNWERLNPNYVSYLNEANFVSGGTGHLSIGNEYVFEANAHIQLPGGFAFEPVVQYAINPNSFYNPMTASRPRSGVFIVGTLVIPVGTLLGLQPGSP